MANQNNSAWFYDYAPKEKVDYMDVIKRVYDEKK